MCVCLFEVFWIAHMYIHDQPDSLSCAFAHFSSPCTLVLNMVETLVAPSPTGGSDGHAAKNQATVGSGSSCLVEWLYFLQMSHQVLQMVEVAKE